jgi:hypothetical protein
MNVKENTNKPLWIITSGCLLVAFWLQPTQKPVGHYFIWFWKQVFSHDQITATIALKFVLTATPFSLAWSILIGWLIQALICGFVRWIKQRKTDIE